MFEICLLLFVIVLQNYILSIFCKLYQHKLSPVHSKVYIYIYGFVQEIHNKKLKIIIYATDLHNQCCLTHILLHMIWKDDER